MLFADRFVRHAEDAATDLATGDQIVLRIAGAGAENEQRQWVLRCETLQKLHHPALARLVDYGSIGGSQRFEAWQCGALLSEPSRLVDGARERASAVLRACGFQTESCSVRHSSSGPIVLPGSDAGRACERPDACAGLPVSARGLITQERRAIKVLSELFEPAAGLRPKITALWGPAGAGKRTAISELARVARASGFVPISVRLLSTFADRLSGRSLFLIDDGEREMGWRALVSATLATPRPHVLLFVGREEVPAIEGFGLDPISMETLERAVYPPATNGKDVVRIRRAAAQAAGWPGRFARLLWGDSRPVSRAAEQSAAYSVDPCEQAAVDTVGRRTYFAAPEELVGLRRRMEAGIQLLQSGRHASGERTLRQAIGALARREDWHHAGEGSLALAKMLIERGRVKDAQSTLRSAADYWRQSAEPARLIDVAVLNGTALTELARLEEAETVLSAAVSAARAAGDSRRTSEAILSLARVLFWRGRYDEAEQALQSPGANGDGDRPSIGVGWIGAAIAVGRRALDQAVSRSAEAMRRAGTPGDPHLLVDASYGAAFAHLAIGDFAAVERDVAECVRAARVLHLPLQAARARLILAEALRRSGRHAAALMLLGRISRLGSAVLPPIVRARCDLLRDALSSSGAVEKAAERLVASTGLQAIDLYLPAAEKPRRVDAFSPVIDDIVHILDICQTSADEAAILRDVARRVRDRIHAAAVAIVALEDTVSSVIASEGDRVDGRSAVRAAAVGTTIGPHRSDEGIEAAAPIRYGGAVIGGFVARWTLGTPHDLGPVASLLTAAAAAVAPIVAAAIARRQHKPAAALNELIGISAAMADVRRIVERAASAPFAALIEGESGCGKELVARALHRCSPRRERPFCTLNCAALPDDLVEAELFGHARGAFTGAIAERPGVFEEAHGGTLFLDEIGELSLRAQAKVLRVLQDGELRRIGENHSRRIEVRVVSATNRDLRREVAAARFRLDLWYRLDVIRITVPPLRERREDIAVLAEHFWRESAARVGSRASLATATVAALARYDWPGNVRELQNVLASLAVRSARRGVVPPTALGPQFGERQFAEASRLEDARRIFEERFVRAALVRTGGHRTWAARELGITRQGLTKLMARLGIAADMG